MRIVLHQQTLENAGAALSIAAVALVLATAGCSDDQCGSNVPAAVYDCFTGGGMPEGAVPEGLIEVGTGREQFEAMTPEQDLPLIVGLQGGFHFEIRTRIQGLDGGSGTDKDGNPRTLLSAYNEAGERIDSARATCGFFVAYEPGEDYDELPGVRLVIFGLDSRPAVGQRVRIMAEIVDQCGRYASNDVWVVTSE